MFVKESENQKLANLPIIIWVVRKAKLIALIEGSEWKTGRIYENFWYC